MLKFRVVNLRGSFYESISSAKCLEQRNILQAAINEIGEEKVRHITVSSSGGYPSFTIFYHEDDPA